MGLNLSSSKNDYLTDDVEVDLVGPRGGRGDLALVPAGVPLLLGEGGEGKGDGKISISKQSVRLTRFGDCFWNVPHKRFFPTSGNSEFFLAA